LQLRVGQVALGGGQQALHALGRDFKGLQSLDGQQVG
jgi:hypothetical protein